MPWYYVVPIIFEKLVKNWNTPSTPSLFKSFYNDMLCDISVSNFLIQSINMSFIATEDWTIFFRIINRKLPSLFFNVNR